MHADMNPINEHPGYFYSWVEPLQTWILKWKSIPGVYSPPVFDENIRWIHLAVPTHIRSVRAFDLEKLAADHGIIYLFYREDLKKLEIWANELEASVISLNQFLNSVRTVKKSLSD